jgi:hypothetical protein
VLDEASQFVADPAVGEFYAGQFTDGSWYRCHVDALHPDRQVSVSYIDYGNTETIPYSKLRPLQQQWCALPGQVCGIINCTVIFLRFLQLEWSFSRDFNS